MRKLLVVCVAAGLAAGGGAAFLGGHPFAEVVNHATAAGSGMVIDRVADRLQIVHVEGERVYAFEDHFLYVSEDTGRTYQRLGRLPKVGRLSLMDRVRDAVARSELVRRVRRYSGPKNVVVLGSGTILVFYDRIYRSADGGRSFEAVPGTEGGALPQPFPSSVGIAVGPDDAVYFGEYTTSARPHPVRIIRGSDDGRRWEVAHRFPPGELFHVHSVSYDPYRDRFWVAAGDRGDEPRLLYTDDDFASLHVAGCCNQAWRLVDMIITEEALIWGSDDDEGQPAIFRFTPETGELVRLRDLDNPSYHAGRLADGTMAITTTYEPLSPFTRAQNPPASTSLWISQDGRDWTRVLTLEGDSARWSGGERPQLQIPGGDPLPALFVTPWFTEEWDFTALRLRSSGAVGEEAARSGSDGRVPGVSAPHALQPGDDLS